MWYSEINFPIWQATVYWCFLLKFRGFVQECSILKKSNLLKYFRVILGSHVGPSVTQNAFNLTLYLVQEILVLHLQLQSAWINLMKFWFKHFYVITLLYSNLSYEYNFTKKRFVPWKGISKAVADPSCGLREEPLVTSWTT